MLRVMVYIEGYDYELRFWSGLEFTVKSLGSSICYGFGLCLDKTWSWGRCPPWLFSVGQVCRR